jgi:hypothetical protein
VPGIDHAYLAGGGSGVVLDWHNFTVLGIDHAYLAMDTEEGVEVF